MAAPHSPHTPASCKTPANLLQLPNTTQAPRMNNEWKQDQAKARSLNLWPRSERSSLPSALRQAVCAELQPFTILEGNQGIWQRLCSRTGQTKYTKSSFIQPFVMFSLEGQGGKRHPNNSCCFLSRWGHIWSYVLSTMTKKASVRLWLWQWAEYAKVFCVHSRKFIFLFCFMMIKVFILGNTKHLQTGTKPGHCGSLHSNIPVWWLAGFLPRLLHAI